MVSIPENDEHESLDMMDVEDNTFTIVQDNVSEPKLGMTFDSCDDVLSWYASYAKQSGFGVCKRSSVKGDDGEFIKVTVTCSRFGKSKRKSTNPHKRHPIITKTDCKAKIRASVGGDRKWRITSFFSEHNHGLSPGKSRFYGSNWLIKPRFKRKLERNDRDEIVLNKSFNSLLVNTRGHGNLPFLEKDCRNSIEKVRRLQLGEGDAQAIMNYFTKMQEDNANFFFAVDCDEESRIRNVFWADARSRAAYKEFGDVITFDTTYLTNKYSMPFAPFVGVNHHGQSTLLGCGLISSEDTETFTWLFQSLLKCMTRHPPSAIITDQDRAMQKAIETVFPGTRHRWCLWHIMKKIPENLGGYKEYDAIKYTLQSCAYDSVTSLEFEENWRVFIDKYDLESNDWLSGLYDERRRWVPAFVKDCFWAGMSITQRNEKMNAFFHGYVNRETSLKQFVEQYEIALRSKVKKENKEDFACFNSWVPCITTLAMEKQFQDAYTTSKFKEFQQELNGKIICEGFEVKEYGDVVEYEVFERLTDGECTKRVKFKVWYNRVEFDVKCNCRLFESRGIVCRHTIVACLRNDISFLPEKYILRRWRKDVKRCHNKVKISYIDWASNPEVERFDKMCNSFADAADMATDSEAKCLMVMKWIHNLKVELAACAGVTRSNNTSTRMSPTKKSHSESNGAMNETCNVLTPLALRTKRCPPLKGKQSKLEQAIKKEKQKTTHSLVTYSNQAQRKELQNQDSPMTEGGSTCETFGPDTDECPPVTQTQGSIAVKESHIPQSSNAIGGNVQIQTQQCYSANPAPVLGLPPQPPPRLWLGGDYGSTPPIYERGHATGTFTKPIPGTKHFLPSYQIWSAGYGMNGMHKDPSTGVQGMTDTQHNMAGPNYNSQPNVGMFFVIHTCKFSNVSGSQVESSAGKEKI